MRSTSHGVFACALLAAIVSIATSVVRSDGYRSDHGHLSDKRRDVGVKVVVTNQQNGLWPVGRKLAGTGTMFSAAASGRRLRGHGRADPGSRRRSIRTSRSEKIKSNVLTSRSMPATSPRLSSSVCRASPSTPPHHHGKAGYGAPAQRPGFLQLLFLGAGAVETTGERAACGRAWATRCPPMRTTS